MITHRFILFTFILILSLNSSFIYAQSDSLEIPLDDEIEKISEESFENTEDSQMNEIVEDLVVNPVELNTATIDDFLRIPYINLDIAKAILDFRNKHGVFLSVGELNNIDVISSELLQKIKPFIFIDRNKLVELDKQINLEDAQQRVKNYNIQYRQRYYQSFPKREGFETGRYYNSPFKVYNRLTADYSNKYFISLLSEKDPGEKSYLDFISASLFVRDLFLFKRFVIGDYVLEFGQGISMWRQIGFSKSADALYPIKKKASGIVQYKSTDENQFFRGFAFTSRILNLELTFFYSGKYFDARIDSITNLIASTPLDGYHRNESEISKKNSAKEQLIGSRLSYLSGMNQIGFTFYNSKFDKAYSPNSYFKNYENNFHYISTDFNFIFESINLFGEVSKDKHNNFSSLMGIQSNISKRTNFVIIFRNFPAKYINLHGYGFGERNGKTNNERGFYLGLKHSTKYGIFNLYFDQFKFFYPLTYDKTLTGGKEILFAYESPMLKRTKYLLKYKNEIKEINSYSLDHFNRSKKVTDTRQQQNLRLEIQKFFGRNNRTTFRIEYVNIFYKLNSKMEEGLLAFGDLNLELIKNLKLKTRIIYFQTNSFDSRVYQLESDIRGVFSSVALHGKGWRWYSTLIYRAFNIIDLSLKYSELYRDDVKKLGTGYDEIPTNLTSSLTFQIEVKF